MSLDGLRFLPTFPLFLYTSHAFTSSIVSPHYRIKKPWNLYMNIQTNLDLFMKKRQYNQELLPKFTIVNLLISYLVSPLLSTFSFFSASPLNPINDISQTVWKTSSLMFYTSISFLSPCFYHQLILLFPLFYLSQS